MKCSACVQRKIDARLELYPAGSWPCASGGGEVYDGSKETAPSCQSETSLWPDCRRVPVGLESTSSLEDRFALVVVAAICLRALQGCEGAVGGAVAVFSAFVALLSAFVSVLPYILAAGLIAFAGGWIIHNVNF